jgi:hypothetical protein
MPVCIIIQRDAAAEIVDMDMAGATVKRYGGGGGFPAGLLVV